MKTLKTALLALVMFIGAAFVPAKAHAQIGPFPCGGNSDISTFRPEVPYFTGQVVIRYGVSYQSLTDNNRGNEPCFSPSQWSNTLSGAGGASLSTTSPQTFRGPIAASTNGTLNESLFSGGSVTARVLAACSTLPSGDFGVVVIPPTETATDSGFSQVANGCVIQDQRGLVYPNYAGAYNIGNGTNNVGGQLLWRQLYASSSSSAATTNPLIQQLHMEEQAGGYNNFVAAGNGQKTNYVNQYLTHLSRTPGQHNTLETALSCYSNGDCYSFLFLPNCYGSQTANGDEGCEALTGVVTSGFPALTATVTAINGSTLTMNCVSNCAQLGEQQPLLVSSRATYTTGTIASIAGTPPAIVGSGTSWSTLCPGGTAPCSPSSLFFEFTAETSSNIHVILPVTTITDDTHITLFLQATLANQPWLGHTTTGAYTLYTGSRIATTPTAGVPYTAGQYGTIYAVVVDPTQYQVGDSILGPGAPNETDHVLHASITANVPVASNPDSAFAYFISNGHYPISNGVELIGSNALAGWSGAAYYASWLNTPFGGVRLQGPTPSLGFFFGDDPAHNNLEKMLGTETAGGSAFDYIYYDRSNGNNRWQLANLFLTGSATIPTLNGNTVVGGSISKSGAGVLGTYQNLLKYSQFDSASIGSTWITLAGSTAPVSITSNTTAVTDPNGGNTAEAVVMPGSFTTGNSSGQEQAITLTSGLPYTAAMCFRGAAGGEQIAYGFATFPYDTALTLTTSWQCVAFTATPSGTLTPGFFWDGQTPSATIYVAFAQLEQAQGEGFYVHTTSSAFAATSGLLANSIVDPNLTPGTAPVCPNGTNGALTNSGCGTSGGVTSFNGRNSVVIPVAGDYTVTQVTGAPYILCRNTTDVPNTGSITENVIWSCTIPANTVGTNSQVDFSAVSGGISSNTGTCTYRWYLNTSTADGGTAAIITDAAAAGVRPIQTNGFMSMRNSLSAEAIGGTYNNSTNLSGTSYGTAAYASTANLFLNVTAQNSVAGDTCNLNMSEVKIWP